MKFETVSNDSTNNSEYFISTDLYPSAELYEDHPFKTHTLSIIEIVHGVRCEICGKDIMAHMKPVGDKNG